MPTTRPRLGGKASTVASELPEELREFLSWAGEGLAIGSERVLRALKSQVDGALFRLRAWETLRDAETRQWARSTRDTLAHGGDRAGLQGEELKKALEERRHHLPR